MDLFETKDPIEQYESITRVAKVAEASEEYDSIGVYDIHFHTIPVSEKETTFECWTISAGLSRDTENLRLDI